VRRLQARPYLQSICAEYGPGVDLDDFPYCVPALRELQHLEFHADVTFFVGENGSGKSTLLEAVALALGFGIEGGTVNNTLLNTARAGSALQHQLKLSRSFRRPRDGYFLRAESFHNVATYIDEMPKSFGYGDRKLHARSHGEAFMTVLLEKFRGQGLYLLDEPEAALSPNRQMAALSAIHQLVRKESQFIIVTHSPILLAYPNAKIYCFDATGISDIAYEDTEHYAVTRDFLNHYPLRLEQLFADD
jgi:predicted ATPase